MQQQRFISSCAKCRKALVADVGISPEITGYLRVDEEAKCSGADDLGRVNEWLSFLVSAESKSSGILANLGEGNLRNFVPIAVHKGVRQELQSHGINLW